MKFRKGSLVYLGTKNPFEIVLFLSKEPFLNNTQKGFFRLFLSKEPHKGIAYRVIQ